MEHKTARYFLHYIREDDRPRPIPKFMVEVIESVQGLERKRSKSSDREPWNWLPRLKFLENDFFLATAGLLILKTIFKGAQPSPFWSTPSFSSNMTFLILCRASEGEADAL